MLTQCPRTWRMVIFLAHATRHLLHAALTWEMTLRSVPTREAWCLMPEQASLRTYGLTILRDKPLPLLPRERIGYRSPILIAQPVILLTLPYLILLSSMQEMIPLSPRPI